MNIKKAFALFLSIVLLMCSSHIFAYAETDSNASVADSYISESITIIFNDETSIEAKEKIIAHFTGNNSSVVEPKGLTCTILGHNLETGSTETITHKVRTTSPRCLKEIYSYELCSRCDYSEYSLVSSKYIACCSE